MDLLPYDPPGLFGRETERNAFVELHNGVVAALDAPGDFGPADADRIGRERGVDLRQAFFDERLGFYVQLFEETRAAGLDAQALRRLAAAADTLALTTADLAPLHERIYGDAVATVLEDDRLSVDERLHLYALQTALGLGPGRAEALYHAPARARLLRRIARALSDGEMPPDQAEEVAAAAHALAVPIDAALGAMLATALSRWTARTGPLPVLTDPIVPMRSGETAHLDVPVQWAQVRSDDLRDALSGRLSRDPTPQQRLPTHDLVQTLRPARLVVTSTRLVLVGPGRPALDVPVATLREAVTFSDGLVLDVSGDSRRVVLELDDETESVSTLLGRLVPPRPDAPGVPAWWRPLVNAGEADDLAASSFGWSLPGHVRTEKAHVVLSDATGAVRIGIPRVRRVSQLDRGISVEIAGLAGWIVTCRERADDAALYEWIARRIRHR